MAFDCIEIVKYNKNNNNLFCQYSNHKRVLFLTMLITVNHFVVLTLHHHLLNYLIVLIC